MSTTEPPERRPPAQRPPEPQPPPAPPSGFPPIPEVSQQSLALILAQAFHGAPPNPIFNKVNETHISAMLANADAHSARQLEAHKLNLTHKQGERPWRVVVLLLCLGAFGWVCHTFKDKPDVIVPILSGLGGLVAGFLGGMGWANRKRDDG